MEDPNPVIFNKPIRCIVKLGGAAITCKNQLEKINEENLSILSSQLSRALLGDSSVSTHKVVSLDWSRRPGKSEPFCDEGGFEEQCLLDSSSGFVVVHGAGSFGHFQASKSGVHKGGLNQPFVKAGFVATRISLASADLSMVTKAIDAGFVPVLHGDAVLDDLQGCTILSGDVIIRHLAAYLKPEYVVFIHQFLLFSDKSGSKTDVLGVYDRPPYEPNALLLREIAVSKDGCWSVVKPTLQSTVDFTVAAHDTTGGMITKISEAAMIARLGIDVYIVKAATEHSLRALSGELRQGVPDDWLGTVIRFSD